MYFPDDSFRGKKLSAFLRHKGCSAEIIKELKSGGLLVNGAAAPTLQPLCGGDRVEIIFEDGQCGVLPNLSPLVRIIYEDGDLAVIDKPPFMPIHESPGHYGDTLANHFAALHPDRKFRAVTRLDKNTSGLCVAAAHKLAAAVLCENKPKKVYYAAVEGAPPEEGVIKLPIGREEGSLIKRTVTPDGKTAVTRYRTVKRGEGRALLEVVTETGRTHQIRVHLSAAGFPLLGDGLYGGDCTPIERHALHCGEIRFFHPISGEEMSFCSPLPEDMEALFR